MRESTGAECEWVRWYCDRDVVGCGRMQINIVKDNGSGERLWGLLLYSKRIRLWSTAGSVEELWKQMGMWASWELGFLQWLRRKGCPTSQSVLFKVWQTVGTSRQGEFRYNFSVVMRWARILSVSVTVWWTMKRYSQAERTKRATDDTAVIQWCRRTRLCWTTKVSVIVYWERNSNRCSGRWHSDAVVHSYAGIQNVSVIGMYTKR